MSIINNTSMTRHPFCWILRKILGLATSVLMLSLTLVIVLERCVSLWRQLICMSSLKKVIIKTWKTCDRFLFWMLIIIFPFHSLLICISMTTVQCISSTKILCQGQIFEDLGNGDLAYWSLLEVSLCIDTG